MPDVVTFGEAMIRLSPPSFRRIEQATTLEMAVGGAELNVAVGVSRLGMTSSWVSCLPRNPLGRMVRNKAREHGVGIDSIRWADDGRMGLYFVEYGSSPRASAVLYDRAGSCMSLLGGEEFDWDEILRTARLFHTTGITPALGTGCSAEVRRAMEAAHRRGLTITYDLNYRARLWTEEQARIVQEPLMEYVDVLITTEEDTRRVFGIEGSDYRDVAKRLADRYGFRAITITLRTDSSVLRNGWTAIAYSDGAFFDDRTYDIELVDRLGGGDAYAAGFIFGFLTNGVVSGVRHGNALSSLKQSSWSDFSWATAEEVEGVMKTASTRIAR